MALPKLFQRIFWHNNTTPAINEDNLNAISKAVDDIDNRVIELAGTIMEDVPEIQHDLEILEPAIENIDANVTRAETAADNAETEALKSEGYALGTQDGVEVTSGEYYQNNAKYYAEIANPPIENIVDFTDIITISDAINKAAKDVRLKVEAVQDLHGYTKPWVGGAGKNLLPLTLANLKSANTDGTWADNVYTINGGTVTVATSGNNVTRITVNGTFTATTFFYLAASLTLSATNYYLSGCPSDGGSNYRIDVRGGVEGTVYDAGAGAGFTVTDASGTRYAIIRIGENTLINNKVFYPQLEKGTVATRYATWENICPITGWDNAKVTRGGKNLYVGSPSFDGYVKASEWTKQDETYNGHDVYKRSGAWEGAYKLLWLKEGTYTFSVSVKTSDGGNVALFLPLTNVSTAVCEPTYAQHQATSTSWTKKSITFTVTTAGTVACRIEKEGSGDIYISEYQLEVGSTATEYEPYQGKEITISLNGTRYGGTLDVTSGVLTLTHGFKALDGSEGISWTLYTGSNNYLTVYANVTSLLTNPKISGREEATVIFNMFETRPSNTVPISVGKAWIDANNGVWLNMAFPLGTFNDSAAFNTWLASNNLQFTYELATPQTIQLTAEEVDLLYGYNTLFGDCGDISLTYDASGIIHIEEAKLDTETLKTIAAASSDFADFKARIAAL